MKELLAKATPLRSGDQLAGVAAGSAEERVAAQMALADLPLKEFLSEPLTAYETDEVTRLIFDSHNGQAFREVSHLTMGEFREWLLDDGCNGATLAKLAPGLLPEMAAAVSKIMRQQDLIQVARKIRVTTRFRTTVGLPGRLSTRLQPNHPADDPRAIAAGMIDGLMLGSGDAVIGINPASDNPEEYEETAGVDRYRPAALCHSRAELRFSACDHADGGDWGGRAGGSGFSIDRRNGSN